MKHLRISQPLTSSETKLHQIGYVHSTQGLKGDIFIVLKSVDESWLEEWTDLVLGPPTKGEKNPPIPSKNSLMSFEIDQLRFHKKQGKQGIALRLVDLNTATDVEPLVGHSVWIPEEYLESRPGEKIFLKEIEGFRVIDKKRGDLGPIVGFSSNGVQDLIEVHYKGENHYIPLVDAFLERIDKKDKKIFMDIPEGLLEL